MKDIFTYQTEGALPLMPTDWQKQILSLVARKGFEVTLRPTSVTSREADPSQSFTLVTVDGETIKNELPWLYALYTNQFREWAKAYCGEPLDCGAAAKSAVVINQQRGSTDRYECHIDSNPVTGLLYVTDQPEGSSGELVAAHSKDAKSTAEVDRNCAVIFPKAGHFLCFDGYHHPHYVRPLNDPSAIRVAVVMNYYTKSITEKMRPQDLDAHLGLQKLGH